MINNEFTSDKLKSVIEKITKLRALQSSSNVHEASNAAAMVEKLIQEYNISEAELQAKTGVSDPIVTGAVLYSSARLVPWKHDLAVSLANHYGVLILDQTSYTEGRWVDDGYGGRKHIEPRRIRNYRMIGRETDTGLLQFNFLFFVFEIERLADMNCAKKRGVSVEKLQYCSGAVAGIMARIKQEKREAEKLASAQALVCINNKIQEAKDSLKFELGKSSYQRSSQRRDPSAYERGYADGSKIRSEST